MEFGKKKTVKKTAVKSDLKRIRDCVMENGGRPGDVAACVLALLDELEGIKRPVNEERRAAIRKRASEAA